jgi:hypothetical protein
MQESDLTNIGGNWRDQKDDTDIWEQFYIYLYKFNKIKIK